MGKAICWFVLAFVTAPAWALDNGVTLHNVAGRPQGSLPQSISRLFAPGELPDFARPRINRSPAEAWQCDVKSRWRDHQVAVAVAAASHTTPITVTAPSHGFLDGERVRISGVEGNSAANGTWTISDRTEDTFVLSGARGNGDYTGGGQAEGPTNGSLKHAIVTFRVSLDGGDPVRVDFVNSAVRSSEPDHNGLDRDGMLSFNGGAWGAAMSATAPVREGQRAEYTVSARDMLAGWDGAESPSGVRYWLRGPLVTQVIVEDRSPALAHDFGWQSVRGSSLVAAIGLEDGQIRVADASDLTAPTTLYLIQSSSVERIRICHVDTASTPHTLTVCPGGRGADGTRPQAWLSGAQFGALQWKDAEAGHRSLHPLFILTFHAGWSGVKVDHILENAWISKMQGQEYALRLLAGQDLSQVVFERPTFRHNTRSRWRKSFWQGEDAEFWMDGDARRLRVRIDHNLPYLIHTGALPNYDQRLSTPTGPGSLLAREATSFRRSDRGDIGVPRDRDGNWLVMGAANWGSTSPDSSRPQRDFQGEQEEGGILARRQALFVRTWHEDAYDLMFGTSVPGGGGLVAVQSHMPVHFREDGAQRGARAFTAGTAGEAFGRVLSIDVRPTFYAAPNNLLDTNVQLPDRPVMACTNRNWPCYAERATDSYNIDLAHQNDYVYLSYLITGDYYLLEEAQFWAAANLAWRNPSRASNQANFIPSSIRRGSWGYVAPGDLMRNEAWGVRAALHAAFTTPNVPQFGSTAMPELVYLHGKITSHFQIKEGMVGIADGLFPPVNPGCEGIEASAALRPNTLATTEDRWCWGRLDQFKGLPNPLAFPHLGGPEGVGHQEAVVDASKVSNLFTPYQFSYYHVLLGHAEEMGFLQVAAVRRRLAANLLNMVGNRNFNPYLAASYVLPGRAPGAFSNGANPILPDWGEILAAFPESRRGLQTFREASTSAEGPEGYAHMLRASASFMLGPEFIDAVTPGCTTQEVPPVGCTGQGIHAWLAERVPNQGQYAERAKWSFQPRPVVQAMQAMRHGDGQLSLSYSASNADACRVGLRLEPFPDSDDREDAGDGQEGPLRQVPVPDAPSGATYHFRITCEGPYGAARASGTFAVP